MKKKWKQFEISTTFDNSVVMISWDGITKTDAINEAKFLAEKFNRNINEYKIKQL